MGHEPDFLSLPYLREECFAVQRKAEMRCQVPGLAALFFDRRADCLFVATFCSTTLRCSTVAASGTACNFLEAV
jgi:hypothetical protein